MWKNLPRCKPEAQAAYFNNYNNGRDEFGRKVLNPAGVDLTPAVARRIGPQKVPERLGLRTLPVGPPVVRSP